MNSAITSFVLKVFDFDVYDEKSFLMPAFRVDCGLDAECWRYFLA